MNKLIKPRKNCKNCKGLGIQYFADSFDRENGTPCPFCEQYAKSKKGKLLLPYQRLFMDEKAFTSTEILVVILIFSILFAIIYPVLKESRHEMERINILKQNYPINSKVKLNEKEAIITRYLNNHTLLELAIYTTNKLPEYYVVSTNLIKLDK